MPAHRGRKLLSLIADVEGLHRSIKAVAVLPLSMLRFVSCAPWAVLGAGSCVRHLPAAVLGDATDSPALRPHTIVVTVYFAVDLEGETRGMAVWVYRYSFTGKHKQRIEICSEALSTADWCKPPCFWTSGSRRCTRSREHNW